MAVGVTQPGGAGTTIMIQTDTSAANGLYYTSAEIAAAFPADFVDLGTTPKSYRVKVDLQNGDGALTATTTWKDTRSTVVFDAGKTYIIHTTGQANRYTEFGTLATGADGSPIGLDGLNITFGINPKLSSGAGQFGGNHKFYGCYLANTNAAAANCRLVFVPVAGGTSDWVDVTTFTSLGLQGFGLDLQPITRMRRVNSTSLASGVINGHITQFSCADADDITLYWPNGDYKISTGGYIVIGNPKFIGGGSIADARSTFAMILKNPEFSQNVPKYQASSPPSEEWWSFGVKVMDGDGNPISGASVEVWDSFDGRFVVQTTTTALGTTDFLPLQSVAESPPFISGHEIAPFRNALMIYGHNNGTQLFDHQPFTLYVNRGQGLPLYPEHRQEISFPYTTFLTTEKQWAPLYLNVNLGAASGAGTTWVELTL